MSISLTHLLVVLVLYAVCAGTAVWYVLRLRKLTTRHSTTNELVVTILRDTAVLALLPIAASIVVFFLPSVIHAALVGDGPTSPRPDELAGFFYAQLIWSLPSACFYVLGTRLLGQRFTLRKVMLAAVALLAICAVLALATGSALPQYVAGLVAQVVAGVLPLSVTSSFPATISIRTDGGWGGFNGATTSIVRAGCLCAAVVLGYVYLQHRLNGSRAAE